SLDRGRAEDLAQETFLQLHRSRHTYRAPRPVRPWAFGIARYVFLADRRRARRRPETLLDAPDLESLLGGWAPDYAERRQLGEVLSRLRPDQREILVLRFAWGLSHEDLAAVLAIRPGAAKVRVHRALRQAQALLDDPKAGAAAGRLH
ncbi:MAG TPA: RNA polymerase sigma factor, partial [Gemmatimonadales bacterium]|nr:RNA polymerase sigma factor [Gemmatimonadales bacterium]